MSVEQGRIRKAGSVGRDPRYLTLDAWRGLACLMVVIHHAGYAIDWSEEGDSWLRWATLLAVRRMKLGVSLFFVISGYCIAASADASDRRGHAPWSFLGRRFWRIYPPYWVALLGFATLIVALDAAGLDRLYKGSLAVVLDPPSILDWRQWLGNITLTESWRPHVWGPDRNIYTGVAWSLCFEEQFYMLCFLAIWLLPGRFFLTVGSATLAIVTARAYAWWVGGLEALTGTFPLLWHEFAAGLAVYYRLNVARDNLPKRFTELALICLLAAGFISNGRSTITAAAFGLVLIALRPWDQWSAALPWLAPLRACGRRCYSIYLAHLPAGVIGNQWLYELGLTGFWERALVMIPLVSLAGVALGWAFHAIVESHFLTPPPIGRLGILGLRPRGRRVPAGASRAAA